MRQNTPLCSPQAWFILGTWYAQDQEQEWQEAVDALRAALFTTAA